MGHNLQLVVCWRTGVQPMNGVEAWKFSRASRERLRALDPDKVTEDAGPHILFCKPISLRT